METRHHAQRLKDALESVGANVSRSKSWLGEILGRINALSTGMYKDELVKNNLADFAAEQFEVACYKSLITAAEQLQAYGIAEACRQNLNEDKAMAEWLAQQVPVVTQHFLDRELTPADA